MRYYLFLFFLFSAPAVLQAQTQNPIAQAAKAFQAKDYSQAIRILQGMYEKDQNPAFLYNIGRSYEEWGKYGQAARYYKRVITLKTTPETLKNKALAAFQRIHLKIPATITITCRPLHSTIIVDGEKKGETCPMHITHAPGAVDISVQARGFKPFHTALSVTPDGTFNVNAVLQELPRAVKIRSKHRPIVAIQRPEQPIMTTTIKPIAEHAKETIPQKNVKILVIKKSPWPGVIIGLGVATALGGGVLQGLAYKERMEVKNSSTNKFGITGYTQQEAADKERKAHNYTIGAYVMYGVGGAAVIGGIIWKVLDKGHTINTTAYFNGSSMAIGVTHVF